MKIAVCLFVLCLGLIQADDFAESWTTSLGRIVDNINKVATDKKETVIKLGRKRKSEINHLARNTHKSIKNFLKNSNKYENLTQRALGAQNVTISSAVLILNLVNKTVDGLRKSLQEAGETVTELTKLYIKEEKDYADKCIEKIRNSVKENDIKSAKYLYNHELHWILTITEASNRRITEVVKTSAKSVSDLNHNGAVLVLETADKQLQKLEPLIADNEKLQTFNEFASNKITELAKRSADKYSELVTVCLKRLKELESKSEQALTTLTQLEIKTGNETIIKAINPEHIISPPMEHQINKTIIVIEDEYEEKFNKLMEQISTSSKKLMTDATNMVEEIRGCKDNENCEVSPTEIVDPNEKR